MTPAPLKWDALVLEILGPTPPAGVWLSLGSLDPKPKWVVQKLRAGKLAEEGWLFAFSKDTIFAKAPECGSDTTL